MPSDKSRWLILIGWIWIVVSLSNQFIAMITFEFLPHADCGVEHTQLIVIVSDVVYLTASHVMTWLSSKFKLTLGLPTDHPSYLSLLCWPIDQVHCSYPAFQVSHCLCHEHISLCCSLWHESISIICWYWVNPKFHHHVNLNTMLNCHSLWWV